MAWSYRYQSRKHPRAQPMFERVTWRGPGHSNETWSSHTKLAFWRKAGCDCSAGSQALQHGAAVRALAPVSLGTVWRRPAIKHTHALCLPCMGLAGPGTPAACRAPPGFKTAVVPLLEPSWDSNPIWNRSFVEPCCISRTEHTEIVLAKFKLHTDHIGSAPSLLYPRSIDSALSNFPANSHSSLPLFRPPPSGPIDQLHIRLRQGPDRFENNKRGI
ncbi:hypothetical protein N657DRAFT_235066 [Parathielavia appendiculata]|uniref:Uncharacterized protein n=1 Tax=Parathielavia appendiculata TaxID=2587402 RepID=A0AAN6U844_9PEZI|nr:hypothetical protein N657DRAFT_235066 [Parathielavia appendiculata]